MEEKRRREEEKMRRGEDEEERWRGGAEEMRRTSLPPCSTKSPSLPSLLLGFSPFFLLPLSFGGEVR